MPRISVVVPIYNVEPYLDECLASIAAQTFRDLEVLLVDDGSTDGSAAIAQAWVDRDERFRLISQANAGLGAARNTGIDAATGEFLAFVDSDDMLPPNAYELLLAALDETGSDFATGNVRRFDRHGSMQAPFLRRTFRETRLRTHVTKFQRLLVDRIVPNKLWRRSFWDEHHLRFPEGMAHEDIPVVLPAQFLARTVDVIHEPVYLYRIRGGDDRSITQRRTETPMLLDRIAAVQQASAFLAKEGPREAKEWYDASVVAEDLRYYLNVLDSADEDYRELFLDRVNELLDTVDPKVFDELTAIERLKWHLVRRRLMPELLEVLWFQREKLTSTPPLQIDGHWYGDYPYRDDERLKIPREIYRIDGELKLAARVDDLRWEGDTLHVGGYAFITRLGAPRPDYQRVSVSLLRPGRLARVRLMLSAIRLATSATHRPEVTAFPGHQVGSHEWAGFAATLDARRLRRRARRGDGTWNLYITVRVGKLKRRRAQFWIEGWRPAVATDLAAGDGTVLTATPTEESGIAVRAQRHRPVVHGFGLVDDAVELTGELGLPDGGKPVLQVAREDGQGRRRYKITVAPGAAPRAFTARVPLADLLGQPGEADGGHDEDEPPGGVVWELQVTGAGPRRALALPREAGEDAWARDGQEVALLRTREGAAVLVVRDPAPVVTSVRWTDDRRLVLAGRLAPTADLSELVLRRRYRGDRHVVPLRRDEAAGTFEAELAPAAMPSLAGELPLPEGAWQLFAAPAGASRDDEALVRVTIADALHPELPAETVVDHKPFRLVRTYKGRATLVVEEDLAEDERGSFHQRTLQRTVYTARRSEPLTDTVVFDSFRGRQYSDSPRAIHEELVRRGAPVEHLWVVRDGACRVPPSARVVRAGSREHYEVLARARWVVANDHFPNWFRRRDDQIALQTWHGTPLKQLGHDASETSERTRAFDRHWPEQVPNWQFVVSPSGFATPIMRRAYDIEGEILETGYPRNDVFHRPDRAELERRVRARLGIPEGVRTILYAPTFRDHVIDRKGHYRLDLHLDVERLREAAGPDTVVLFRTHHYIVDPVPATADGFVRDVTSYPDANELLLAADVLITDYSSMMFDYANTGRPMLFFTYDLEDYAERIRGFYLDFPAVAPGPLLRTSDDVADALRDIDAVHARHADRYAAFVQRFCEHDDGGATARVVDRVFGDLA